MFPVIFNPSHGFSTRGVDGGPFPLQQQCCAQQMSLIGFPFQPNIPEDFAMASFPKIRFLTTWFVNLYWRTKVYGIKNIPPAGPFVVVANHASILDPYLIDWASKERELYFLAKEELFRNRFIGYFLTHCNAIPVKRGVIDETAIKKFHEILGEGK